MDRPRLIFVEGIMGSGKSTTARWLARLFRRVGIAARPLHPIIIYCYQDDVARALDRIGAQRGLGWVESQVDWKVASPYGQQRGLVGIEGWKQLYQDYRQLTDKCFQMLPNPKLAIDTSAGAWSTYQTRICTFLDLPFLPEPAWQRWFYKLYDYLVDIR
jgi:hypothetical protein